MRVDELFDYYRLLKALQDAEKQTIQVEIERVHEALPVLEKLIFRQKVTKEEWAKVEGKVINEPEPEQPKRRGRKRKEDLPPVEPTSGDVPVDGTSLPAE